MTERLGRATARIGGLETAHSVWKAIEAEQKTKIEAFQVERDLAVGERDVLKEERDMLVARMKVLEVIARS